MSSHFFNAIELLEPQNTGMIEIHIWTIHYEQTQSGNLKEVR